MPFCTSLKNHNPRLEDVISAIPISGREYELIARRVMINTEQEGLLYSPKEKISSDDEQRDLVQRCLAFPLCDFTFLAEIVEPQRDLHPFLEEGALPSFVRNQGRSETVSRFREVGEGIFRVVQFPNSVFSRTGEFEEFAKHPRENSIIIAVSSPLVMSKLVYCNLDTQ